MIFLLLLPIYMDTHAFPALPLSTTNDDDTHEEPLPIDPLGMHTSLSFSTHLHIYTQQSAYE